MSSITRDSSFTSYSEKYAQQGLQRKRIASYQDELSRLNSNDPNYCTKYYRLQGLIAAATSKAKS